MANGDPILVACAESDVRMVDLPLSHLVGPVVYLDPPLAAVRSAQVPLITSVHTFCFCRLKTAAHGIEHFLRRRIHMTGRGGIAAQRQIAAATQPIKRKKHRFRFNCPRISSFLFVLRHSTVSLLNSPQEKSGAQKCDHRPSQKNHEIVNIKLRTRAIHVHQPKSTAKMCKWKQLGNVANRLG